MNSLIPSVDVTDNSAPQNKTSDSRVVDHVVESVVENLVESVVEPKVHELYASREKIYTRKITGVYQSIRKISLSVMLGMYFLFAWINVEGQQLILFDLAERKFHLFGIVFWPQDFTLLAFALIICAFGLFFVTSLFGRVWCGYTCPQTVWTFMFMWLEEFFEGSRNQRIKLDDTEWSATKIAKKTAKHLSWLILAGLTAITFVGYFYPIRELVTDLLTLSLSDAWTWFWLFFFTAATYMNAGWLREQVCIYMCPYARFQSVMFNESTMNVGYDTARGEPRGKSLRVSSSEPPGVENFRDVQEQGDCVDCSLCVQVCPTGIDIRDGLQYECIGCALCIDACDGVMKKIGRDTGLIRYASQKQLDQRIHKHKFDKRSLAYGGVLILMIGLLIEGLVSRPLVELSALRDRGALYYESGLGLIENHYVLKLSNKLEEPVTYRVSVESTLPLSLSKNTIFAEAGELVEVPVSVMLKPDALKAAENEISFIIEALDRESLNAQTSSMFLGPL